MTSKAIAAMEVALAAAKAAEAAEAQAVFKALPVEYEWKVVWEDTKLGVRSEYVFWASRRLTQACWDAFQAWRKQYPKASYSSWVFNAAGASYERPAWEGMTYVLAGNLLFQVGGGTLILKSTPDHIKDSFSHEPRKLTEEEVAAEKQKNSKKSL